MRPIRRASRSASDGASREAVGLAKGFRSGLEEKIALQIADETGKPAAYETLVIEYVKPARKHKYRPDFQLPNGIIIETKGYFEAKDREKHLLVKEQHPEKDIRFVFQRSSTRISKKSQTTYADWCRKHGFQFADKLIPIAWLKEKPAHATAD